MKRGLHINSYFLTNDIHFQFYLRATSLRRDLFIIPVYKNSKSYLTNTHVCIDYVYSWIDKKFFLTKILKVLFLYYKKAFHKESLDYIHAHTLLSDGLPASILSYITKKPFVVTIRSADVDYFIAKSRILRFFGKQVLKKASLIYLVSPSSRKKLVTFYPFVNKKECLLLPNGLKDFWLQNIYIRKSSLPEEKLNILFVGQIIDLKRLDILFDFLNTYSDREYTLNVVGKNINGTNFDDVNQNVLNGNAVVYHGEVTDLNRLANIYRSNDVFVMLSDTETFGVVYTEALSQGLPIVYTINQGIDGFFSQGYVGYACDQTIECLKSAIDKILLNYGYIKANIEKVINKFDWDQIMKQYINEVNEKL